MKTDDDNDHIDALQQPQSTRGLDGEESMMRRSIASELCNAMNEKVFIRPFEGEMYMLQCSCCCWSMTVECLP